MPIKRCCHAYGRELTGRSQHGHGLRIRVSSRVRGAQIGAGGGEAGGGRAAWWTAWLIGEHLDLSGNYRTGLPIIPHTPAYVPQHSGRLLHRLFHNTPCLRWSMISWSTDGQRSLWRIFHRRRGSLGISYNVFPFRFSFSIIQYASSLVWRQSVDRLYFLSEGEDLDFDEMWTIDWRITEILTNFFLSNAMDRKKFTPILFLYIKVSWLFECIR